MEIEKYIFVKPELKAVYNKIVDNNKFQSFLKKIGAIVTIDDYYNSYDLPSKTNKDELKALSSVKEINKNTILNLANLLVENNDTIIKLSVGELVNSAFLFEDIKNVLGFSIEEELDYSIFKEFYYIYKFSYVDNFFQNNWERFIPEVDTDEINNNKVAKSFVEALMIEFDKINNIINNVKDFKSYKNIPYEYINYLTQLLGFEQLHLSLTEDYEEELRVIAANIIDIYRMRGTISSFELLFNFLGFNVEIIQYYFDRRYKYNPVNENKETQENDYNNYRFYLTKNNPADNIANNFPIAETVSDSDFIKPLSFESFSTLVDRYGIDCVLGYSDVYVYNGDYETNEEGERVLVRDNFLDDNGKRVIIGDENIYTGPVYSYFLTNVIDIKPALVAGDKNFNIKQLNILSKLLKFLVPEFWKKQYVVTVNFGEGNDKEKMTVNGHRNFDKTTGIMLDGFRMLDDEDWIYNEGNEYFFDRNREHILSDPTEEYYKKQEREYLQALIDEKKNRVLQLYTGTNGEEKYVKINDNTILEEIDWSSYSDSEKEKFATSGCVVHTISEIIKLTGDLIEENNAKVSNEEADTSTDKETTETIRYFKIINNDGSDRDIRNDNTYIYTNSIGEFGPRNGFFESFTKKLGDNKIKIINSTKGAGALMRLREGNSEGVYKFWKRNSCDGKNDNYWYPPKNQNSKSKEPRVNYLKKTDLYYPVDNSLDPSKSYSKVELTNFNSMEGQSIRKSFLAINNETRTKLTNLAKYEEDSLALCLKKKMQETKSAIISNGIWELATINSNGIEKAIVVTRNSEDKTPNGNYLSAGTLSKFVKTHNVVNYDYVNEQLLIGEYDNEQKNYFDISKCKFYEKTTLSNKFDANNRVCVYSVCYNDSTNTNSPIVKILKESFDIGSYYLQRKTGKITENNIEIDTVFYVVYRLNEPKIDAYDGKKLMSYRYRPTNIKYKSSSSKLYDKNISSTIEINNYAALLTIDISNIDIKYLNKYLKIKKDSGKISILSKQPTEYRILSYDKTSNISPSYIIMSGGYIDDSDIDDSNSYDGKLEENQLIEFNNVNDIESGDFYFNFSALEDRNTSENFDTNKMKDIIFKRAKKIIAKKQNCVKGEMCYYNGKVYKTIFNGINVLTSDKTFICDRVKDGVVIEKKYFGINETNSIVDKSITPGIEGSNYMLDNNGNLVPGNKVETKQYTFTKKIVEENNVSSTDDKIEEVILGLKPVNFNGKIEVDATEAFLYSYDNKYNGVSEEEDGDNYILNNNRRKIKWDIVNGIYKNQRLDIDHEFNNKKISRPVREIIDKSFDDYIDAGFRVENTSTESDKNIENRKKFLRNIFEEMLGNTASLNIVSNKLQEVNNG